MAEKTEIDRLEQVATVFSSHEGFNSQLIDFRFRKIKTFFQGNSLLELGPADGQMTQNLINHFKNITVVDGSKLLLKNLENFVNKKINKVHSLFENFDTKEKFDVILMAHILEHVNNPRNILTKYKNYLKEDGLIIVTVPNALSFHRMIGVQIGMINNVYQLNETDKSIGHRRVYDLNLLEEHAKEADLRIIEKGGIFLKFLSNNQMSNFSPQLIESFYKMGNKFPNNCAEIYIVCQKK